MACAGPRKRISTDGTNNDIISCLPAEIKQKILTKMPIKDTVRTAVLSSKWRFIWTSIPEIVVKEDELIPDGSVFVSVVDIVDMLLFMHHGPILKFHLSMKKHCPNTINRWISNLAQNGITKLTLLLTSNIKYKVSSHLYWHCHNLQHVDLSGCLVKLPSHFEGFKLLTTLWLSDCIISGADLERLVSPCPQLVELVLVNVLVEGVIRIYSTGLTSIKILGNFSDFQIDAPHLKSATIGFCDNNPLPDRMNSMYNFCLSLGRLSKIEGIGFLGFSIPHLVDKAPVGLLKAFHHLNWTALDVNLADQSESEFVLLLLQHATKLQNLTIYARVSESATSSTLWEKDIVFKHLRTVTIQCIEGLVPVLAFVKFILGSAPVLRTLALCENPDGPKEENPQVLKQLVQFRRESAEARIIFM